MSRFTALLKGSAVVTAGTLVAGALSYVYSAAMGRMLGPADFGDLGAINAYFVLSTAVGGGLLTVTMYYTSSLFAQNDVAGINRFHSKLSRIVFFASLILAGVAILTAPITARFFSISSEKSLVFALISIVISLLLVVNRGVLQGSQQFGQLTNSNIVEYAAKLVAAYLLVRFGFSLSGATLAIPLGALAAYWLTSSVLKRSFAKDNNEFSRSETFPSKKELTMYFLPALASNAALLLLMNLDILLVKKFFEAELAGQYVAVSTVAKIIFYITGPITAVMFPLIAAQRSKGEKHYHTLFGAGLITVAGSAIILLVYSLFSNQIVSLLYGASYRGQAHLLPLSAVLVVALSLVNLMSQYFLSIRRYWFIIEMSVFSVGLLIYGLINKPAGIEATLRYLAIGFTWLIIAMLFDYLFMKRSQLKKLLTKNG